MGEWGAAAGPCAAAYDVDENRDHFFKDVPDGVNAMLCGSMGGAAGSPMAVVGGNCSIQGFDMEGAEVYWTVTGDNVNALCLADINGGDRSAPAPYPSPPLFRWLHLRTPALEGDIYNLRVVTALGGTTTAASVELEL